eukprot:TRINITY_DN12706_c0_g1_i1.p1 TRINITY_DN12706_c0_g1~~TRINITY_DN12706_c0_g1_i1.p1  ORF type:complete len:213 (+),score=58.72 TRINITY_DN12706_c0_g1_i1:19-657(+)
MSSLTQLNPEHVNEAIGFIAQILGRELSGDFGDILKDGTVLCEFINKLKPGSINKINRLKAPFMQMENINRYLEAVRNCGVENTYLFMTVDLYERKNLAIVALNIIAVKRHFGYGFEQTRTMSGSVFDAVGAGTTSNPHLKENVTPEEVRASQAATIVSATPQGVAYQQQTTTLPMPTAAPAAAAPPQVKFCSGCGTPATGRFCSGCGNKLW